MTDTAAKSVLKRPLTGKFRFNLVATNVQVIATSFATVMQAALISVAYSGTDFKPAVRAPLDTMVHWTVVGRLGDNQDLRARPSERSSPKWQGMRQVRCRRRVRRALVAVSSWAVKWQGMGGTT
jgi:hypothetical protein